MSEPLYPCPRCKNELAFFFSQGEWCCYCKFCSLDTAGWSTTMQEAFDNLLDEYNNEQLKY